MLNQCWDWSTEVWFRRPDALKNRNSVLFFIFTKTILNTQDSMCESFLGTLVLTRGFLEKTRLKPSIHIHGDLHAHTEFAVDVMAGSEPEGLYSTVQLPCCWVECRFHRLTLTFTVVEGERGCFRDSRGWAHRANASIKTWCCTQQGEIDGSWISCFRYESR